MAEFLLSKGANIEAKDKNESTPLHTAAFNGKKEVAELFIKAGANINA